MHFFLIIKNKWLGIRFLQHTETIAFYNFEI